MRKLFGKSVACLLAFISAVLCAAACGKYVNKTVKATELTAAYSFTNIAGEVTDDNGIVSGLDNFGVELLKEVLKDKSKPNALVSPLSAFMCLGMVANGAENETLAQFENVLGSNIADINAFGNKLLNKADDTVKLADSVWIKNGAVNVEDDYLKTVKEIYNAEVFRSDFDALTLKDVNNWCSNKTEGMIPEIIDTIEEDDVIYVINALFFDAKWQNEKSQAGKRIFTNLDGAQKSVDMFTSNEQTYIDFGNAQGFLKGYRGGKYSFLGILPNDGTTVYEFAESLTGEKYFNAMSKRETAKVSTVIPEFSFDYSVNLSDSLISMGIERAFNSDAEFDKMGRTTYGDKLYLGYVLQKTRIELDRNGTKAAAVTIGGMKGESAPAPGKEYLIILDRPFMFGIVDNATGFPLFLGTVTKL